MRTFFTLEGGDTEFANFTVPTLKAFLEACSHKELHYEKERSLITNCTIIKKREKKKRALCNKELHSEKERSVIKNCTTKRSAM